MKPWGRSTISTRRAEVSDCGVLAEIHASAFKRGWSDAEFEALLLQPGVHALLAHYRNALGRRIPAGFILYRLAADEAEILSVAVIRPAAGAASARRSSRRPCDTSTAKARRAIHLEVEDSNTAAIGLYRGVEFRESGRRAGYYVQGRGDAGGRARHAAPAPLTAIWRESPLTDEAQGTLEELCAEKGMRMTEQRRVDRARARSPLTTIRTWRSSTGAPQRSIRTSRSPPSTAPCKLFEDSGIIERHDFGQGRARYETLPEEHHDHLIDLRSGTVIEFRDEEIEKLQERIARKLGYKLVDHRLELYAVPADKDDR